MATTNIRIDPRVVTKVKEFGRRVTVAADGEPATLALAINVALVLAETADTEDIIDALERIGEGK